MTEVVIDTSALLAWLGQEPGWEKVDHAFATKTCKISAVNLAGLVAKTSDRMHESDEIAAMVSALPVEIVPFDRAQAFSAGVLRAATRNLGLLLGARACLALSATLGAPALTADKPWLALNIGVHIECIR
ncbi:MAG: type II toxin-antitoxin system VapC family toxin [Gammaproteobacteria bacterium]|nr:type II toxin-antitoxin system VapC family toxin [Gammaproteobacteria bacterium]